MKATIYILVAWNLLMLLVAYGYAAEADKFKAENKKMKGIK